MRDAEVGLDLRQQRADPGQLRPQGERGEPEREQRRAPAAARPGPARVLAPPPEVSGSFRTGISCRS